MHVYISFFERKCAHAIPRDRKHEQTNFSPPHQSSTAGLLVWSVPQLLGSQTSGSPVPGIATAQPFFSSAHLTMCRGPGPHSASGCYQRPCRRGSLHSLSSPCWKSLPRLSQPGFGIGSAAIQDWRHWTELGLLEYLGMFMMFMGGMGGIQCHSKLEPSSTLKVSTSSKRRERWGSPSTSFYQAMCFLPWNWRGMSTFKEPFMSGWHSMGPLVHSLQSPMMSNVTVAITVTEAVFSHLLRTESSDTRTSHAHKQTQGAPFCTCNTRQYIRTSSWSVNSADRGHKFETGVAGVAGVIVRRGHSHGSNVRPAMQNALWKLHEIIINHHHNHDYIHH